MTKRFALALAVALAVGACSGQTASALASATSTPAQNASPSSEAPSPAVTPTQGQQHGSQVIFSTSPASGAATSCTVDDQVATNSDGMPFVSAGVPVYATYFFTSMQGSGPVSVLITKNGLTFHGPVVIPTASTQGRDCFADPTDQSQLPSWGAGQYGFMAVSGDAVISQGDLKVLAP